MRMSEILRTIADAMDSAEPNTTMSRATPVKVQEPELELNPVMIPPLQAKLEILKKSEGLPNVYGEGEKEDELLMLKKRAGLSAAQMEASDDNDIVG